MVGWPRMLLCVGVGLLLSVPCAAQITKGKSRPAATKQIMSGLVKPSATAIAKATRTPPADDQEWKSLATQAALLNEASYILMDDGRCPDAAWENAAKALRSASEIILAKVESKDIQGVAAQIVRINESCAVCHKAHKKS